jgi:transcriptional regulator with GAF, ATPase, and Fis domain
MTPDEATQEPAPEVREVFARLAGLVYAGSSTDEVNQAIVNAVPQLVTGCDHASLMLRDGQRFWTAAASDETAAKVDVLEREVGAGPCVDALLSEEHVLDADIADHSSWPTLARRVLAETPVRGMLAFRLFHADTKAGALNIFSDRAGALDAVSADRAALLAAFASVTIAAAHQREQAEQLRRGLQSNREIGQAVGLLMAAHRCNPETAFDILRKTSSDLNMKLAAVAKEVVDNYRRA